MEVEGEEGESEVSSRERRRERVASAALVEPTAY